MLNSKLLHCTAKLIVFTALLVIRRELGNVVTLNSMVTLVQGHPRRDAITSLYRPKRLVRR